MPKLSIEFVNSSVLKSRPEQSTTLKADEKHAYSVGRSVEIRSWEEVGSHIKVEVAKPIYGRTQWFAFGKDVEVVEDSKKLYPRSNILLKVPYYQQVDNKFEPMRTCNTSSCAMVARYLGAKISGDDEYYQKVIRFGDTTDHGAQTKALASIGIQSQWSTTLGFDDLYNSLSMALPIVIGILHRGLISHPTGGHMIVVIGTQGKDFVCHDPFGSLLDLGGGYTGAVKNGDGVVYPRFELAARWTVDGARSGWGRTFYGNK